MKQIQIIAHGGPDRLQPVEIPDPKPKANQAVIDVHYSGINFADIMCRIGLYPNAPKPPFAPGYEVTGIVKSVGENGDETWVGKPVLALTNFGGYADRVCVPMSRIVPLKDESECAWAVALPVNYITAELMLFRQAALRKGEWVLIHGIGGGVGVAALQLALNAGANVIGTASSWKHERLRELGVKYLIDYHNEDVLAKVSGFTDNKGVDVVLDPIGGKNLKLSYKSLNSLGRLVAYGFSTAGDQHKRWWHILREYRATPKFNPVGMMQQNKGVFGFHLGFLWDRESELKNILSSQIQSVRDGDLKVFIDQEFPLIKAGDAHRYIHDRKNFGKVVLVNQISESGESTN